MRAAFVVGSARRSAGALLGTVLAMVAGCKKFTGPYMCADGYASCVNPGQNACETDTTTDGLNCGDCGMVCAVGAPCLGSSCGPAAVRIAQSGSSALVRTNASAVVWSGSNLSATIYSLPLAAAAGATPAALVMDGLSLGEGHTPFAVDDASLYYLASISGTSGGCPSGGCANLVQVSLANGARTTLLPWAALSALLTDAGIPAGNAGGNFRSALAVNASHVFLLFSLQSSNVISYAVAAAEIGVAAQNGELLTKTTSTNGFSSSSELVANSTSVVFETWDNNNSYLRVVRIADKQMSTLSSNGGPFGGGIGPLAADESSVYTISSGCPCNNDDNRPYNGPPPGAVTRIPFDGSAPQRLATFWGSTGGIDINSTHVYWSTDTTAWKVPLAGGTPVAVAGNLSNGVAAYQCMSGCNGGSSQSGPTSIAVASSALYVAATGTEQSILKVAR